MDRALRIGLIGPLPPPAGGMANQTAQLRALLTGEGHAVTLVQVNPPYRPAWVSGIRGLRAGFRLAGYLSCLWRAAGQTDLFHVMANSGWSWHLFAAPAIRVARLRGIPVIVNYRGGEADAFFSRSMRRVRPLLEQAAVVIVPSGYLHEIFRKWGIPARVVPNIVDLELFRQAGARHDARISPRILVARHLEPIYDIASAIRAFALVRRRLPDAVMTIAGEGPERAALEAEADRAGLAGAIEFTGRVDNRTMAGLHARADVLLNTSLVDNMPISLLEAMASGVPIVSTGVGGIPYLVRDRESALLVEASDSEAMAEALVRVIEDRELACGLAQRAAEDVRAYAWPEVRARLFDAYRTATGGAS